MPLGARLYFGKNIPQNDPYQKQTSNFKELNENIVSIYDNIIILIHIGNGTLLLEPQPEITASMPFLWCLKGA